MTGTSMAAPHVAGIAAVILHQYPSLTPVQVQDTILARATVDQLNDIPAGSPNRLAFVERKLTGEITGPSNPGDNEIHTWYANPGGGNLDYTFEWSKRNYYPDGSVDPWLVLGSDENLQYYIILGHPNFELRLKIWASFQSVSDYEFVTVACTSPCIEYGDPATDS